jgi:hypothetical protein
VQEEEERRGGSCHSSLEKDESTLLIASATFTESDSPPVHLDEGKLFIQLSDGQHGDCSRWILDLGATNHMTGDQSTFTKIDRKVHDTMANIKGRGTFLSKCKTGDHKLLAGVYLILHLTANIVSLGQLEEDGHKIVMHVSFIKIWDHHGRAMAKVKRAMNMLYMIQLDIDQPVYLATQGDSPAWRWHLRFGHLNFCGLQHLAMAKGLPWIDHVDQVCDNCLTDKQRCLSFLGLAKYRVTNKFELVHEDLCGPVTPVTPTGKRYFFLPSMMLVATCG